MALRTVTFGDLRRDEGLGLDVTACSVDAFWQGKVVCAFALGSLDLTSGLWAAIVARFREVGRMLTDEELRSVVEAEEGHDDHC